MGATAETQSKNVSLHTNICRSSIWVIPIELFAAKQDRSLVENILFLWASHLKWAAINSPNIGKLLVMREGANSAKYLIRLSLFFGRSPEREEAAIDGCYSE